MIQFRHFMIFPIFFYVNDHAFREVLPKSHDEAWTASWETRTAYVCRSVMNVPDNVRIFADTLLSSS